MKTILVIDDERSIAMMIADLLEGEGYRVLLAHDGQEGYELLTTQPVDLIISDVMMPRLDGRELVERLRQDSAYQHLPIILMSAALERYALDHQAVDGFVKKPFVLTTLLGAVQALLEP